MVKDEILYYVKEKSDGSLHSCVVVPQNLKHKAMEHAHINSGHLGQKKTILEAEELYYWNNLKVDICNYVKNCVTCQEVQGSKGIATTMAGNASRGKAFRTSWDRFN